jgi:hypothetical protein
MTATTDLDPATVQRTARYVDDVLTAVDGLPPVFLQRRTGSPLGWITMPGNRQLVRLFVSRQLGTNLRRMEAEVSLEALRSSTTDERSKQLGSLANTVGVKTSKIVPIAIVLATIGLAVSLLSIAVPALQDEADLLGSMPKVVINLDGATVAANATAFDGNGDAFSPRDFQGVFNAVLLASCVVFALFSVLAGSSHAASSILRDPDRYHRRREFLRAVRHGPLRTQRFVFGKHPSNLYLPVTMDIIRDAAFYAAVLLVIVIEVISGFAAEPLSFLEIERVGGLELAGAFTMLLFPAAVLVTYLGLRHRRRTEGEQANPPAAWRVTIGAALALICGLATVVAVSLVFDVRLTYGPDLWIYADDGFMSLDVRDEFAGVDGATTQSLAWYPVDVATGAGPVAATLVVTELDTVRSLVDVDETEFAAADLRNDEELVVGDGEVVPQVWVSDALRERLDQSSGDLLELQFDDGNLPLGVATVTFDAAATDELVVLVDVEERPPELDDLLIDDIMVRGTGGPLRDGSATADELLAIAARHDLEVIDLRREPATDRSEVWLWAVVAVVTGLLAVQVAFRSSWRSFGPTPPADSGGEGRSLRPPMVPPHLEPRRAPRHPAAPAGPERR